MVRLARLGLGAIRDVEAARDPALLERDGVLTRCQALIELLEMRTMSPRGAWKGGTDGMSPGGENDTMQKYLAGKLGEGGGAVSLE